MIAQYQGAYDDTLTKLKAALPAGEGPDVFQMFELGTCYLSGTDYVIPFQDMRQAYMSLPTVLREAAIIDGCNSFQFFLHIGLPLTVPFLGSLGIYTFLQVWNQYLWPLLVTNNIEMRTVQIGIGMLQNADAMAYGPVMAGTVMILVPSILVFIFGQKTLISGLTAGSVKG